MASVYQSILPRLIFSKTGTVTQIRQLAYLEVNPKGALSTIVPTVNHVRRYSSNSSISFNHDTDDKIPKRKGKGLNKVGILGVPTALGQVREMNYL